MENPDFLKEKYDLHNTPEVNQAAQRTEIRTGQEVPLNPADQIQNYLDRFKEILDRENPNKRERGIEALKQVLWDKFVTKQEDIPESFWKSQENIIRERGQQADYNNFSEEQKVNFKKETSEGLLNDQQSSLEQWLDYFASADSNYLPDYLKYWVFRSVTQLAEYDKEKKEFPKRSKGTVRQFPDINQEALNYVIDAVIKKHQGKGLEFEYDIQPDEREAFLKSLEKENFAKLYAWANDLMNPIPEHLLPVTQGEWKKFEQNSNHTPLVQSIRGKGTGWCTAGENTAKKQLASGAFHCFYSLDDEGQPTIPRLAIRMERDKIAEVRGVARKQNLDPYMPKVLEKKLEEFPDKEQYLKKDRDMKQLTEIDNKVKQGQELNKNDLTFLYELNSTIEGFGYQRDSRIAELRANRNPEQDMLVIFECTAEQIARAPREINENTKVYIGQLEPGIFQKLPETLEHIYTSFPDKKIRRENLEIGGKTADQLIAEMTAKNINITNYAKSMLKSREFIYTKNSEEITLIRLTVADLGFKNNATADQVYQRAEDLGLELCPADTCPNWRLKYQNQPLDEWVRVAMKQIPDSDGYPGVFGLLRDGGGLWLSGDWAGPGSEWSPGDEFVFRLRPPAGEAGKSKT